MSPLRSQDLTLAHQMEARIKAFGFTSFAWLPLKAPPTLDQYRSWLENDYHGEMKYLEDHLELKSHPGKLLPGALFALVVTQDYYPAPQPCPDLKEHLPHQRIALYAQNSDYHHWFLQQLKDLAQDFSELLPKEDFLCATDSKPILERDLAVQAGLGWVGKNTCLIHPQQGSLFFIGEILTTWAHPSPPEIKAVHDFCGTCNRCIEACPTQAFQAPRELDARKCISYLTIESKVSPPESLRPLMGDWLFGCDICQTVCPWNEKVFGPEMKRLSASDPVELRKTLLENSTLRQKKIKELSWILSASGKALSRAFAQSPLSRAAGRGLKRNAMIVAANLGLFELKEEIEKTAHKYPPLQELSQWCLERIKIH